MRMKGVTTYEARRGQAMLLAILTLGATMLGATTIAGLLMVYQIRQVTNFRDSAESIFAADAGTEWALYSYFQQGVPQVPPPGKNLGGGVSQLGNDAMVSVACFDVNDVAYPCSDETDTIEAVARGSTANTKRTFITTFSGAPGSLP